jgi:hypothetical protein
VIGRRRLAAALAAAFVGGAGCAEPSAPPASPSAQARPAAIAPVAARPVAGSATTGTATVAAADACRRALAEARPRVESGPPVDRVGPALLALAACPVLDPGLRRAATEAAGLQAERRAIRLHAALPPACRSASALDLAVRLPPDCKPEGVSDDLLARVESPIPAFAATVYAALGAADALDDSGRRVLDTLLLGAALEAARRGGR